MSVQQEVYCQVCRPILLTVVVVQVLLVQLKLIVANGYNVLQNGRVSRFITTKTKMVIQ